MDYDASRLSPRLFHAALDRFEPDRAACLPLRSSLMAAVAVTAAQVGGVGRQIVRDRVLRFNAEGPDGLLQRSGKRGGTGNRLNECRADIKA